MNSLPYRGRLAPSPTGFLHLGHAQTFWTAQNRTQKAGGILVLRNEDLDHSRCKSEFAEAILEDLKWFGFEWQEGPDCGGPHDPYVQSQRLVSYRRFFEALVKKGCVYPCSCSRKDVQRALRAPHAGDEEPIYPGTCRPKNVPDRSAVQALEHLSTNTPFHRVSWRFQVPDGETVSFCDGHFGPQSFVAGKDFGDFVIWRHDNVPSYQLAVAVDDHAMAISEVVRGADLLLSTARQLLIYRAFGWTPPDYYHCPLVLDEAGQRLAKRHDALSLRTLRQQGLSPADIRTHWKC